MQIKTITGVLLTVSEAQKEDLADILALQYTAFQSEAELVGSKNIPPLKQSYADIEKEFSKSLFLKATNEFNEIVGSVRGMLNDGIFHVGRLIVHPKLQGQGIGTELLHEIERISGCEKFELFTSSKSASNIRLYERVGYVKFREEKILDGLTLVYLHKDKN